MNALTRRGFCGVAAAAFAAGCASVGMGKRRKLSLNPATIREFALPLKEQVRLAMGLPYQRITEYAPIEEGIEKALDPESYYEPPLMNVIKFACNKCPDNVVRVTDMCQGCLEHPCMEVCPMKIPTLASMAKLNRGK